MSPGIHRCMFHNAKVSETDGSRSAESDTRLMRRCRIGRFDIKFRRLENLCQPAHVCRCCFICKNHCSWLHDVDAPRSGAVRGVSVMRGLEDSMLRPRCHHFWSCLEFFNDHAESWPMIERTRFRSASFVRAMPASVLPRRRMQFPPCGGGFSVTFTMHSLLTAQTAADGLCDTSWPESHRQRVRSGKAFFCRVSRLHDMSQARRKNAEKSDEVTHACSRS